MVKRNEDLIAQEESQRGRESGLVLKAWAEEGGRGGGTLGLEERVQILDEVVTGLWGMSEPGSRYSRVVRRFESWLQTVQAIREARERGKLTEGGGEVVFIAELEDAWRDELRSQSRKVDGYLEKMAELGGVEGKSGLAGAIRGFGEMARRMKEEVGVMKRVETAVVRAERDWIRTAIEDESEGEEDSRRAGAIWRRL